MTRKSTGIVTKKFITRRTVLRGLGTTIALPVLDAMIPRDDAAGSRGGGPTGPTPVRDLFADGFLHAVVDTGH